MPEVLILGSANAVPDATHENTHFLVIGQDKRILVDAPGNPISRLHQGNIDPLSITDLIVTHFHPDHISGVPLFLMVSWLTGRKSNLHIYGLEYTLSRLEKLMDFFEWAAWPGMYPCVFHHLPEKNMEPLLNTPDLMVYYSMVKHIVPNIGLRFEFINSKRVLTYSSDTEPIPELVRLGKDADMLIHEASGATLGHTSAEQAGEIASEAGAKKLVLIHYPTDQISQIVKRAKKTFAGEIILANDLMRLSF